MANGVDTNKKVVWDEIGNRTYETGVDHVVVYPMVNKAYPLGVAWNGITTITESPSGAEANPQYADNIKYLNLISNEEFGATIEAFMYPDEFAACDGTLSPTTGLSVSQQTRKPFGLCYRTILGNDEESNDHGYKIHLIYNALAAPSEKGYSSVNDSPEAITFSWELTTTPTEIGTGYKPAAHLVIDSTKADATKLVALLDILYGKDPTTPEAVDGVAPRLPLPSEIITLLKTA